MRKVTFGSSVFIAGLISAALLLAGAMSMNAATAGQGSAFGSLYQCGLLPVFIGLAAVALIGLVIAIVGLAKHEHAGIGHHHDRDRRGRED